MDFSDNIGFPNISTLDIIFYINFAGEDLPTHLKLKEMRHYRVSIDQLKSKLEEKETKGEIDRLYIGYEYECTRSLLLSMKCEKKLRVHRLVII